MRVRLAIDVLSKVPIDVGTLGVFEAGANGQDGCPKDVRFIGIVGRLLWISMALLRTGVVVLYLFLEHFPRMVLLEVYTLGVCSFLCGAALRGHLVATIHVGH